MHLPKHHPTPAEFLDSAKEKLGVTSDYALAKYLRVSNSRIGNYRSGRSNPDEDMCLKLARILDYPPSYVLAIIQSERSPNPDARRAWRDSAGEIYQLMKTYGHATVGALALAVAILPQIGQHDAALALVSATAQGLYIM